VEVNDKDVLGVVAAETANGSAAVTLAPKVTIRLSKSPEGARWATVNVPLLKLSLFLNVCIELPLPLRPLVVVGHLAIT